MVLHKDFPSSPYSLLDPAEKLESRLNNPNFAAKAPPEVVEKGRADLAAASTS